MNMKSKLFIVSLCVAMCACNDNAFINEPVQENEVVMSRSGETPSSENYTVTPEMVCKYLNIARKGKTIDSLTPVIENGDTLAYVAQYADTLGWDLISGDRRLDPILGFSTSGILNINDTDNPSVNALQGMLDIVRDIKASNKTDKNQVWESLESKTYNRIMPREMGVGMWIALDTASENEIYTSQRLIKTKWGQGSPWNIYTPYIDNQHCVVGCVGVATAFLS